MSCLLVAITSILQLITVLVMDSISGHISINLMRLHDVLELLQLHVELHELFSIHWLLQSLIKLIYRVVTDFIFLIVIVVLRHLVIQYSLG